MTNQEILEKSINKAIEGGFSYGTFENDLSAEYNAHSLAEGSYNIPYTGYPNVNTIIFSHDFARALWGGEKEECFYSDEEEDHPHMGGTISYPYNEGDFIVYTVEKWKYHLQNMVIAADPIKYLGENI